MSSTLVARAPAPVTAPAGRRAPNPSLVLAIILATYLMIILDATIVITALPKIHRALGFSSTGLSWVQNAYTLDLRGISPPRRPGRRHPGPPPRLHGRDRRVHPGFAGRGPGPVGLVAAAGPGRPGRRRRHGRTVDPGPAADQLPRGPRAGPGHRGLQRRGRRGRQRRARPRGDADQLGVLALGAVHQRPHRRGADLPGAALPARVRATPRALRPDRRGHLDVGDDRPRLRVRPGRLGRMGEPDHRGLLRRRRRPPRRLRPHRDPGRTADHARCTSSPAASAPAPTRRECSS